MKLPYLAAMLTAAGCAGGSATPDPSPPLTSINDAEAHTGTQEKAIRGAMERVERGEADGKEVREQLKRAAWARSRFYKVRLAALEELLSDEAEIEDTRNMMRLMLPTETQWNVISFIGTTAAERGWTDLTTALVRCWSKPAIEPTDADRPERKALEALHPARSVEEVVFGVFKGEPGLAPSERGIADSREREQQEAWAVLRRIDADGLRTTALLASPASSNEDPTLTQLRSIARDLGVVPDTAEQLAWAQRLSTPAFTSIRAQYVSAVARLNPEQRRGLELRHLPGVAWATHHAAEWLAMSREELLSTLDSTLEPRRRHVRAASATASRRNPESLRTWRDELTWGDALLVLIAARAIEDPALARALFAQAEEDRADTSTEHGGVIDGAAGGFGVRLFPPRPAQRVGDRRFIASAEMIEQGTDALFHYHLHCTSYDNSDYAGPSEDDLGYAQRQGRSCLVLTCVSRDTLNADYYQPGGATLDLGEVRRPE